MPMDRREFLATSAAPTVAIGTRDAQAPASDVDTLFNRSIVIDAPSVDDNWNEPDPVFAALARSGVTAVHTTLANRNLTVAQQDLTAWNERFQRWPDRLMRIERGVQFAEAKASGRIGVLLGFQNATIVESRVRNLDALHKDGTRCIQLTYNSRNLLGDRCTERTNASTMRPRLSSTASSISRRARMPAESVLTPRDGRQYKAASMAVRRHETRLSPALNRRDRAIVALGYVGMQRLVREEDHEGRALRPAHEVHGVVGEHVRDVSACLQPLTIHVQLRGRPPHPGLSWRPSATIPADGCHRCPCATSR